MKTDFEDGAMRTGMPHEMDLKRITIHIPQMKIVTVFFLYIVCMSPNGEANAISLSSGDVVYKIKKQIDTAHIVDCRGKKIKINLPEKGVVRVRYYNYTEGLITKFVFADSSEIEVHCGKAKISLSAEFVIEDSVMTKNVASKSGILRSRTRRWRQDCYKNRPISISFFNVPFKRQKEFDGLLDQLGSKIR